MAAPNILALTTATGKTAYATPSNTSANVLLANAASSGKVFKVNQLVAANLSTSTAVNVTVSVNTAAGGGGTSYPIVSVVSVPAQASLIVADKTTQIYLEEDKSILVTSGLSSNVAFTVSYEELS